MLFTTRRVETMSEEEIERKRLQAREQQQRQWNVFSAMEIRDKKRTETA